ncbi:MAG: hypothetical protein II675_06555 [Bacteroidaceae bacterium]|nr:hypothetical protein [Bacteroidaceae bacterium]
MKTLVQITGVQYACPENSVLAVMAELEKQHPEVLLVTEHTHDYGIIVRALIGTEYRGVVSRFDIEQVLRMMQHDSTATLVGQLAETDLEGRCFTVCIDGDYPTPDTPNDNQTGIWSNWQWTGAPLLDSTADDRRLDISLKVTLAGLRQSGKIDKQTLLEHLDIVLKHARWDISRETQKQLNEVRNLLGQHTDNDLRALAPKFRHTLTALGSKKRTKEFQDTYLPELCRSDEAGRMRQQWYDMHKAELGNLKQWEPTINTQLEAIENCLMSLPADLCYQRDLFGDLMHRLLYLDIPRRKLNMLLSALVLRRLLRRLLGLPEDNDTSIDNEAERLLIKELTPIFNYNPDWAHDFLLLAKGKKTTDITHLVSHWVRDRRICPDHCHRPLWTALHDAGIYNASESNWNLALNVR